MAELMDIINNMKQEIISLKNVKTSIPIPVPQQSTRILQLDINKKENNYNYIFNRLNNITHIKLIAYDLPKPRYNILTDMYLIYIVNNIEYKLLVKKGFYDYNIVIETLNRNEHLLFSLDITQIINVKSKQDDVNFTLKYNDLLKIIGFTENSIITNVNSIIIADNMMDLRLPLKLQLYISNIQDNYPFGLLNFNGSSSGEIHFNNMISLSNLNIIFKTEDNNLYDFNSMAYNLSFQITIIE